MAEKTLEELSAELRKKGITAASEKEILASWAEKAAKREAAKAKKASEEEFRSYFPEYENNKTILRKLAEEIRNFRKDALEKGIEHIVLPKELKRPFHLALDRLDYDTYRPEIGTLLIEGLKIQDREMKIASYHYLDKMFAQKGGVDFGWISQMLTKRYVSRYGWQLLRKHSKENSLLVLFGGDVFGDLLDDWAKDPKTLENWQRLSAEDGKPADMREILPRRQTGAASASSQNSTV